MRVHLLGGDVVPYRSHLSRAGKRAVADFLCAGAGCLTGDTSVEGLARAPFHGAVLTGWYPSQPLSSHSAFLSSILDLKGRLIVSVTIAEHDASNKIKGGEREGDTGWHIQTICPRLDFGVRNLGDGRCEERLQILFRIRWRRGRRSMSTSSHSSAQQL